MSVGSETFGFLDDSIEPVEDGTNILLTGEEMDALESTFFRLLSPTEEEQPLVVSTAHAAGKIISEFDDPIAITCEGREYGENVTVVDGPADLTTLGMELSAKFQEYPEQKIRAGIFHTTELVDAAGDTRSVYRFLNSNLMPNVRRQSAISVAAIHTTSDVGTDIDSMIRGMETSFTGRIHIEDAGFSEATVSVDGLGADGTYDIGL